MCLEFYQSLRNTQNSDWYVVFDLHSSLVILSHKWHNVQIVALRTLTQTQTFKNPDINLVIILNIQQKYPANNAYSTQSYEVSCFVWKKTKQVWKFEKTFLHAVSCHEDEDLTGASARKHQEENW